MTYDGIEKLTNKVIVQTLNSHRPLNMYQMMVDSYCRVEDYTLGIILTFMYKNMSKDEYHGVLRWQFLHTTFGYSLYGVHLHIIPVIKGHV